MYIEGNNRTEPAGPFGTVPQEPWHAGQGAKPDHVIQLTCGEVCSHASYKTKDLNIFSDSVRI